MRHAKCCAHSLPLNDRLFQAPFYLTHAGWERVSPFETYPLPGHPPLYAFTWGEGRILGEFLLGLVTSGEGELQTDHGRQQVRAGQSFLYMPGEWHRHRPLPSVGWSIMWINFSGDLPHRWMRTKAFQRKKNLVEIASVPLFKSQFRHLVQSVDASASRNSLQFSWQAIGLLSHILKDVPPAQEHKSATSGDPLVDAAIDYVWSQSHNNIGVPDVARHVGANRRTLERRFKAATQNTVLNEIQNCRIARAALLLRETDAQVKYVVGRSGFATYRCLRQAFQNHFHLSPEAYRRTHRNGTGQEAD